MRMLRPPQTQRGRVDGFSGFQRRLLGGGLPGLGGGGLRRGLGGIVKPRNVGLDEDSWGIDHGTWSVLVHAFPDADIPVVQLSIHTQRDFDSHLELGAQLAPLRDRGVLIVGSGNVVHNLRALDWSKPDAAFDWNRRFDEEAHQLLHEAPGTAARLGQHTDYAISHPTPDHFIPLLYIAGVAASSNRPLERVVDGYAFGGLSMASYAVDATDHLAATNNRPSAGLPDPRVMPPDDTNV